MKHRDVPLVDLGLIHVVDVCSSIQESIGNFELPDFRATWSVDWPSSLAGGALATEFTASRSASSRARTAARSPRRIAWNSAFLHMDKRRRREAARRWSSWPQSSAAIAGLLRWPPRRLVNRERRRRQSGRRLGRRPGLVLRRSACGMTDGICVAYLWHESRTLEHDRRW